MMRRWIMRACGWILKITGTVFKEVYAPITIHPAQSDRQAAAESRWPAEKLMDEMIEAIDKFAAASGVADAPMIRDLDFAERILLIIDVARSLQDYSAYNSGGGRFIALNISAFLGREIPARRRLESLASDVPR